MTSPATTSPTSSSVAPEVAARERSSQRDLMVDVVRGIAISLVALGHTNQGIIHRGWWGPSTIGLRLDSAIYAFHMPAFFFVSGVFLRRSVAKRGEKGYTLEKLRTIIYPHVFWAFIALLGTIFFARFTIIATPHWKPFLLDVITGNGSWFLPTLFFASMIGMFFRRVPMPLLFGLSVVGCLFVPHSNIAFEDRGIRHLPFLVAGMWVGSSFSRLKHIPSDMAALGAALLAIVIVWITAQPEADYGHLFLPLGFMGTLMLMLVARCLKRSAIARAFAWTGVASFGIFLMSAYPQGGTREFMARVLHTTAPGPQLIFPTLLAVIVPAWLYHLRKPLHIQWMFIWPF